ncbi:MAG: hypothetical protein H0X37_27465 [Herpetosiphonaceae bacterium]|nr:hypothetical protein [Herpetosiphonaceae bacterium]
MMLMNPNAPFEILGAIVRHAIIDALGTDPDVASDARAWLAEYNRLYHLDAPEAAQFAPDARRRNKPKQQPSAAQ